ncbi:hypothetical protein [Halopenitus sp. POP-27]|uniref:hypothetical protein n=1 Tax=Halopenitus sp. POP-27 TaxID=2994425 RepID=UPI002469B4B6|nr:hypothetical protein [Halopenitus sp. POP-27]
MDIEAVVLESRMKSLSIIDEKRCSSHIVFLRRFSKQYFSYCGYIRRKRSTMVAVLRFRIGSHVEPELLIGDSNRALIDDDPI